MKLSLGIDIGTTAIKATVIDGTSFESVAVGREDHCHMSTIKDTRPNFHEQDPICILRAVDRCLQQIDSSAMSKVSTITVAGQMHGVVCWDNNYCRPTSTTRFCDLVEDFNSKAHVSSLITWQDGRCDSDFLNSLPKTSSPASTGFGCASLFWLQKHNPELLDKYNCAGSIMDLFIYLITGNAHFGTSPQVAHSSLEKGGFPVKLLPTVEGLIGTLDIILHEIPNGTYVNIPFGDFQCSMLASCNDMDKSSSAVLNIGTSAQVAIAIPSDYDITEIQSMYPAVRVFPYFKQSKAAVVASLNGGNVIESFISTLTSWLDNLGIQAPEKSNFYTKFHEFCSVKEDGCGTEMEITPTLLGERHSPGLLASVTGISKESLQLSRIVKQMYKGMVKNIFDMMPRTCLEKLGVTKIAGTGSVMVNNQYVVSLVEEMAQMPCIVQHDVDASYGAALSGTHIFQK
eukprot:gene13793-15236_t